MSELSERLVAALERLATAHEVHAQAHAQLAQYAALIGEHGIVVHIGGGSLRLRGKIDPPAYDNSPWEVRLEFETE